MSKKTPLQTLRVTGCSCLLIGSACLSATAQAQVDIAQQPLFMTTSVEPNIMFILDDSGSMGWDYMPDDRNSWWDQLSKSSNYNRIYYNPAVTYEPPVDADGNSLGDADFNSAWHNGYDQNNSGTTDLDGASYYIYDPTCGAEYNLVCYNEFDVSASGEEQNYANWYSYYRTRMYAARAGIGRAFADLPDAVRIGWGRINRGWTTIDGENVRAVVQGVRQFTLDHREDFYDWLYDAPTSGNTPLRRALDGAGSYFENETDQGPWSDTPGENGGDQLACRRSATVLMSDGYWNRWAPGGIDNSDGSGSTSHTGPGGQSGGYTPSDPFQDSHADTLADVAMHYWKRDLASNLPNRVPVIQDPEKVDDPAFWQHMNTYTVGLGVEGTIDRDDAFDAIDTGNPINWPNPTSSNDAKIDDMLHAGVNSRGNFFSAMDPEEFATKLTSLLSSIVAEASRAAAAGSTNATSASQDGKKYQARLDPENWTGNLLAFALDEDTGAVLTPGNPEWTAADQLNNLSSPETTRSIYTWDGSDGAPFQWGDITADMQAALQNNPDLLEYLRGNDTNEQSNGGSFRDRDSLLGDIVNSSPAYAGNRNFFYSFLPGNEGLEYHEWRNEQAYQDRPDMVYVGANDGMLHGFDAETGEERFAFVPRAVFDRLPALANPDYAHRYYVDGSPHVGDAYIDGDWRTILVGSTGAGGRSVFALDVTDPESFSEDDVLWEFTHDELGYTIGEPTITRLEDGTWVVLFGNGYNSNSHDSSVFMVNLEDGSLIERIEAGSGDSSTPNGMASVTAYDTNSDLIADRLYAGDLQGNMWRIDLDGGTPSNASKLFQTPEGNGERQPITVAPTVRRHPDNDSFMVFFGTGKFLENGDNIVPNDAQIQSFYGIIDDGSTDIERSDLLEQSITNVSTDTFGGVEYPIRTVSQNSYSNNSPQQGWYLDLVHNGNRQGERVLTRAMLIGDRVRFMTYIPTDDPCSGGGINWLIELNALSGGRLNENIIDLSGDGNFDFSDGAFRTGGGPPMDGSEGGVQGDDGQIRYDYDPAEDDPTDSGRHQGDSGERPGDVGRQSWRQIR